MNCVSAGILDEHGDDVLVNVNIQDDEHAEKNVENMKKKPDYKPYDEPQYDEYGLVRCFIQSGWMEWKHRIKNENSEYIVNRLRNMYIYCYLSDM